MAGSRLEKIGTIYSRTTGLIRSGAVAWEDRPLWYDIYEAFPPKEEPSYERPAPNLKVKQIFYEEDKIRATFHRNNKRVGMVNLLNDTHKSLTQRFIETYRNIEQQYKEPVSEEHLYKETIDIINKERNAKKEAEAADEAESVTLSSAFKAAREKQAQEKQRNAHINIKLTDLFKEK